MNTMIIAACIAANLGVAAPKSVPPVQYLPVDVIQQRCGASSNPWLKHGCYVTWGWGEAIYVTKGRATYPNTTLKEVAHHVAYKGGLVMGKNISHKGIHKAGTDVYNYNCPGADL